MISLKVVQALYHFFLKWNHNCIMATTLNDSDNVLKEKITQRLNELFEKSGMSQVDFALEMGSDKQYFNSLLKGRGATIYTIQRFCAVVKIELKDFFDSPLFKEL
jgi:hypothetical protein